MALAVLFVLSATACSAPAAPAHPTTSSEASPEASSAVPSDSTLEIPAAPSVALNEGTTPADSYQRYLDVKSVSYEKLSEKIDENSEIALSVGLSIAGVAMADLGFIGLVVMSAQPEDSKMALEMMGAEYVDVQVNGNLYTVSFTGNDGERLSQTAEYDPATDSVISIIKDGSGHETMRLEYVKVDGGYASQYYTPGDDASIITCYVTENLSAFGLCSVSSEPASLFKNTAVSSDFVKNDELYMIVQGDVLTVVENGQESTY